MTDWFTQRTYHITPSQQGSQLEEGKAHMIGHRIKNYWQSKLITVRMSNVVNFICQQFQFYSWCVYLYKYSDGEDYNWQKNYLTQDQLPCIPNSKYSLWLLLNIIYIKHTNASCKHRHTHACTFTRWLNCFRETTPATIPLGMHCNHNMNIQLILNRSTEIVLFI